MLSEPREEDRGGKPGQFEALWWQCSVKYGSVCGKSVTISHGHDVDTTSNGVGIHGRVW